MMASHAKRWTAPFVYHQGRSRARRTRLHRHARATVCRLVCVARPPLRCAAWLRRQCPRFSLQRAHARVLWPPRPFEQSLVGTGLRRLCHRQAAACAQCYRQRCWPSPELERLGTPEFRPPLLRMGQIFAASLVRLSPAKTTASIAAPTPLSYDCPFTTPRRFTGAQENEYALATNNS
jgi:hypothetical protein